MKNLVLFYLLLFSTYSAIGQATANSDGDWSSTGSWQGGNIGDGGENVSMNANTDLTILVGESFTIGALDVGKNGTITIDSGGELIINGTLLADKEFTINVEGSLTVNGSMNVAKTLVLNVTGTMTVNGNVDMAKDAGVTVDGSLGVTGSFNSAQNATVTVNGNMAVGGDLNLGTGSTILGTGPVSAGECTGSACADEQLPVELLFFSIQPDGLISVIEWATLTEEDNDFFTIERSKNSHDWEVIATVEGNGNSSSKIDYSYIDQSPYMGLSYYRLKQTDFDGTSETFDVKMIQFSTINELKVYPNPVHRSERLKITTGALAEEQINIEIIDQAGQIIKTFISYGDHTTIPVDMDLNPGFYFIRMASGNISKLTRVIIR
ncbi:MAG: T9SS type A sorting domain-containing protein [Cyclobacteriaceae bacterium]